MRRLLDVEIRFRHGVATAELAQERDMLLAALNKVKIQLGFDCSIESASNEDGLSDSIDLFRESSETSCCRLVEHSGGSSRAETSSSRYEEPKKETSVPGVFGKIFSGVSGVKK